MRSHRRELRPGLIGMAKALDEQRQAEATLDRRPVTLASRTTLGAPSYFRAFTAASVNFSGIPHSLCEPCVALPANRKRPGWGTGKKGQPRE